MTLIGSLNAHQVVRLLASAFGVVALIGFFQPWVTADLPGIGASVLTGREIARGDATERVDAASAPVGGAAGAGGGTLGGLTLPTRIPTTVPGAAAAAGGLVLPTRIATPAPAAAAGAASGGLVLPTRIATAVPGGQGTGAGVALATAAAATREAFSTAQAGGLNVRAATAAARAPDRLPGLSLYLIPVAAGGLAIFSALWGRFVNPRDRLYGKVWTILLAAGGTLGAGAVLVKIATAPSINNLLAPGDVKGTMWGLWSTFLGFVLAGSCLVAAWLVPARPARPPSGASA